jgi:hypothetical protein
MSPYNRPHRSIGGVEEKLYSFLTSAVDGVVGQRHAPAAFTPRKYARYSFLLEAKILGD